MPTKKDICKFCNGLKLYPPSLESAVPCPYCSGTVKIKGIKKEVKKNG